MESYNRVFIPDSTFFASCQIGCYLQRHYDEK
jgi:hypothetical protein